MKFSIWPPRFKDLPTVHITLPATLTRKGINILYGYTQPSKPYDKTLFIHLVTPVKTRNAELRKLTVQLRNLIKKAWDGSHYAIVKVNEEYKSYQSFIYFQLKHTESAVVSSQLLARPLKISPVKSTKAQRRRTRATKKATKKSKTSSKKRTRRRVKKKTTRKKKTVRRTHSKKKTVTKRTTKKRTRR